MYYQLRNLSLSSLILLLISCSGPGQQQSGTASAGRLSQEITDEDIRSHIAFLADDSLRGRETGTPGEVRAANYLADYFRDFGLEPAGERGTYFQDFTVNMGILVNPHGPDSATPPQQERISRNVIGLVPGTEQPDRYIVIGAHYDHLGLGAFGSMSSSQRDAIHNGADDNASGTAGILELAQYFSRHPAAKSLLFIGFSGEELGLLGSQHFVENPTVPLNRIAAMINLDMIGRLEDDRLIIFGTGSSSEWDKILEQAGPEALDVHTVADGTGASDHTSFYNKDIPVLHYFTDTHADYHRPSDDAEYINYSGVEAILEHVRQVITAIDALPEGGMTFTEAPETDSQRMTLGEVTLGVTPDYGYEGKGMRITGVRSGGPAGRAGVQSGDVIIRLDGRELEDIYAYMEVLNSLKKGDKSTVTVLRDGEELTFDLTL